MISGKKQLKLKKNEDYYDHGISDKKGDPVEIIIRS